MINILPVGFMLVCALWLSSGNKRDNPDLQIHMVNAIRGIVFALIALTLAILLR